MDGINWNQKVFPVYGRLNGERRVREPWVIRENNSYLMWYSDGENSNLLKSNDGLKWLYIGNFIRSDKKPILPGNSTFSLKVFMLRDVKYFLFASEISADNVRLFLGKLSKDNRVQEITSEPILDTNEMLYKYGVAGACGISISGSTYVYFSGINSLNPTYENFIKIFKMKEE